MEFTGAVMVSTSRIFNAWFVGGEKEEGIQFRGGGGNWVVDLLNMGISFSRMEGQAVMSAMLGLEEKWYGKIVVYSDSTS